MQIARGIKALRNFPRGSVVTIGVFDGVHVGHSRIISQAVSRAGRIGAESVVVTFDPHPLAVLRPASRAPALISLGHRIRLISRMGPDALVVVPFTKTTAEMRPEDFVRDVLASKLSAREVMVGEDFRFGRGAAADTGEFKRIAGEHGIRVTVVRPVKIAGRVVSSSAIRKAVVSGDIAKASRLLGRPASVLGTVVKGARLARSLGYPTANLNPHHEAIPPSGVYAVRAKLGRKVYGGVLNIGTRPTFYGPRDRETSIEVHIFGFRGSIYGRDIEVFFEKKIRDEVRFDSAEDLIAQIRRDEAKARAVLKNKTLQLRRGVLI